MYYNPQNFQQNFPQPNYYNNQQVNLKIMNNNSILIRYESLKLDKAFFKLKSCN